MTELEKIEEAIEKQEPDKQVNNRDEGGKFIPGVSGNPAGRPPGISITSEIKERLKGLKPDEKKTYLEDFISYVLENYQKDSALLRLVWNYVDGMPKQNVGFGLEDTIGEVQIKIIRPKDEKSGTPNDNSI